jgi:DNA-binding XRE family transcriptional regulator
MSDKTALLLEHIDNLSQKDQTQCKVVEDSCNIGLYNRFKALLLDRQICQSELASLIGVDKAYVSRMVHGIYNPPNDMKIKVAVKLGTDSRVIWP